MRVSLVASMMLAVLAVQPVQSWAAGGTALMTVKLSDAASGEVIAEPEFYQHANAMGAAYSFGATGKGDKAAEKDKKGQSKDSDNDTDKDAGKDGEAADQQT